MIASSLVHLAHLAALWLGAEPPHGMAPHGMGAATPVIVEVRAQSATGRIVPATGAEVRLELTKVSQMDGSATLETVWIGAADAAGRATFIGVPELAPGRRLSTVARWHGVEWRHTVSDRATPTVVAVHEVTADRTILRARLGYTVILTEEELIIDQSIHLTPGEDPRAVDLERGEGLPIPLLVHAVFDQPLVRGWMPPRPNPDTTRFVLEPPADVLGRLVVERGAMVYRGIVPPGGIIINAQYPVPYAEETRHTLAMASPVEVETLQVTVPVARGLAPEVALRTPFQTIVRPTAEGVRKLLVPIDLPAIGEAVLIDVHDTPSRLALLRPLTVVLSVSIVIILALVFLRTRRV